MTTAYAGQWGPQPLTMPDALGRPSFGVAFQVVLTGTTTPATTYANRLKSVPSTTRLLKTTPNGTATFFGDPANAAYDIISGGQVILSGISVPYDEAEDLGSLSIAPGTFAQALVATAVKTAPYTAAPKDYVLTDCSGGSVAHVLPTAPPDGTRIGIKMIAQSGSNVVTFACGGSDHINTTTGPTTGAITLLNQAVILQYASATAVWTVQSSDLPLSQLDTRFQASFPTGTYVHAGSLVVSPLDHGAVGGNAVLDRAAFVACVALLAAAGGGTLSVPLAPAGDYVVSDITLPSHTTVDGPGRIKLTPASEAGIFVGSAVTGVTIKGVTLDGDSANQSAPTGAAKGLIDFQTCTDVLISGVTTTNSAFRGVNIYQPTRLRITGCNIDGVGTGTVNATPLFVSGTGSDVAVTGNVVRNAAAAPKWSCVQVRGNSSNGGDMQRVTVSGNVLQMAMVTAAQNAVTLEIGNGAKHFTVSANTVVGGAIGISVASSDDGTVSGNFVLCGDATNAATYLGGHEGIEITAASRVTVSGNTINGNAALVRGISVPGGASAADKRDSVSVSGNTLVNLNAASNSTYGIYCRWMTNATVTGNTVTTAAGTVGQIFFDTCAGVTVTGNQVVGALGTGGAGIYATDSSGVTVVGNRIDVTGTTIRGVRVNAQSLACSNIRVRANSVKGPAQDVQTDIGTGSFSDIRVEMFGSATPALGNNQVGTTVWNSAPGANSIAAWICTVAGAPGTFRSIALPAAAAGDVWVPTGYETQNFSRKGSSPTNSALLTAGRESMTAFYFTSGQILESASFFSGATPAAVPTNQWFSLRSSARVKAAITADDGVTAWAANTQKRLYFSRSVTDAAISSTVNTTTLSSATAAFTSADINSRVTVMGAGAAGVPLGTSASIVTITAVAGDGLSCTLSAPATTTVTGAVAYIATPYTIPSDGIYYVGMVVAAATAPTIQCVAVPSSMTGMAPITVGADTTNTGLTAPSTAPGTSAALTAQGADPYCLVS